MIKQIILVSLLLLSTFCVELLTLNNGYPVDNIKDSLTVG
jgi:hypothetical protein